MAGRDILGIAQTGTGKTAAFALPILHHLTERPGKAGQRGCRALILSPTRELAGQIGERIASYGRFVGLRTSIAIGGVPIRRQIRDLANGVDVLIATPGRLIDLVESNAVHLGKVEILVLDEADRMLDMGFIRPIKRIAALVPKQRQSLFFSATMPNTIAGLAASLLTDPVKVSVTPPARTADRISQQAIFVLAGEKPRALLDILGKPEVQRALVFARTKRGADRIVQVLAKSGVQSSAIHGNKSQPQRERALAGFRNGRVAVLVATDIAARGIDVPDVTHVVNYDLPNEAESYVHRIGRTARAGAEGIAISICAAEDRGNLRAIERLIGISIPASGESATWAPNDPQTPAKAKRPRPKKRRRSPGQDRAPELRAA